MEAILQKKAKLRELLTKKLSPATALRLTSPGTSASSLTSIEQSRVSDSFEQLICEELCNGQHSPPFDIPTFVSKIIQARPTAQLLSNASTILSVENFLKKLAAEDIISLEEVGATKTLTVLLVDRIQLKLRKLTSAEPNNQIDDTVPSKKRTTELQPPYGIPSKFARPNDDISLDELLSKPTVKQQARKAIEGELLDLLNSKSAKERHIIEKFKSKDNNFREFCPFGTRVACSNENFIQPCDKLHFRRVVQPHTDLSLGDCSYLNTCHRMGACKFVHYELEANSQRSNVKAQPSFPQVVYPMQFINCDVRQLDMSILGKFSVIMADPPWFIHQKLPYGTLDDDEMRNLPLQNLMDDGYLFLWVTGRALELARECLLIWGYERVDELVWIKTNQIQRLIRSGRTGHWINHSKEHCLVGVKGNPQNVNRGLDCDVLVSEVRETSQKPDEIYNLIERLSPATRKLEIFGRKNNLHDGWLTLGNQLGSTLLTEPDLIERWNKRYPEKLFKPQTSTQTTTTEIAPVEVKQQVRRRTS